MRLRYLPRCSNQCLGGPAGPAGCVQDEGVDWADAEAIGRLRIGNLACGTGALLSAVYEQIASRHERTGGNPPELHPVMMEEVLHGCEVMPSATHITGSTLSGVRPNVGFNQSRLDNRRFHLPVLGHALQLTTGKSLRVSKHYDILLKVEQQLGRRISLVALARENLRIGKSAWDHRRNLEIWQSSPELLIAHNQEDLNLTARLTEFILQHQSLRVNGKSILLPLDPFGH